jgi:hypothetical protein
VEVKHTHALLPYQDVLLRSSRPLAALEMRRDLKHWQQALALAGQLSPESVPMLSKEHAAALEMVGEHAAAREHYQQVKEEQGRRMYAVNLTRIRMAASESKQLSLMQTRQNTSNMYKVCTPSCSQGFVWICTFCLPGFGYAEFWLPEARCGTAAGLYWGPCPMYNPPG